MLHYSINERNYTVYLPLDQELSLQPDKNYLFDLSYLGTLALRGDKSLDFLQGQLTADIKQLSLSTVVQAAQCNLKGRILSLLDVIHWDHVQLVLPKDLIQSTIDTLINTAKLSRVSLELESSYHIYGFYLANPNDLLIHSVDHTMNTLSASSTSTDFCYYLGHGLYILFKKSIEETAAKSFTDKKQFRGSLAWHQLLLKQKKFEIYPSTRGLFLPHRLGLHLSNRISFAKGCYKGQEIIARTHYKAKLKHELNLFTIESNQQPFAGKKLLDPNARSEVGEIVDYSPLVDPNTYLVAASLLIGHPEILIIEDQEIPIKMRPFSNLSSKQ